MKVDWKEILQNIAGAIAFCLVAYLLVSMQSCKTQCVPERIEIHDTIVKTDSVVVHHTRDSIVYKDKQDSTYEYVRDSVSEKQRNDTIFVTNWKIRYKYVYQSLSNNQSTTTTDADKQLHQAKQTTKENEVIVKTERYIPKFYRFTMWVFWILVVALLIWLAIWVMDKIPATKPYIAVLKNILKR